MWINRDGSWVSAYPLPALAVSNKKAVLVLQGELCDAAVHYETCRNLRQLCEGKGSV